MKKTYYLVIFLLLSIPIQSKEIIIDKNYKSKKIGQYLQILEDKKGKLTINDILSDSINRKFINCKEKVPYYNFTKSAYWIKIIVTSKINHPTNIIFELAYPLMDSINFYYKNNKNRYQSLRTGYNYPFKSRPILKNNFLFKSTLNTGKQKIFYFRFKNRDRMEIPLSLWNQDKYYEKNNNVQYIMGIFLGILIFAIFYNLFLLLSTKDKIYIYYIFFVITVGIFQLIQNGYFYQYFWPTFLDKYNHYIPQSIALTMISTILISKIYLNTKKFMPIINRFFDITIGYFSLTLFVPLIIKYSITISIQIAGIIIVLPVIFITAIISAIRKYRPAKFFLASWSLVIIGGMIYSLKVTGVIPSNLIANYSLMVGFILQIIILSLGLADRIKLFQNEKEEANKKRKFSEKRYKFLVEGSNDIIFTLNKNWKILTINKAVKKHFNKSPNLALNKNIFDLIYDTDENDNITKKLIIEKMEKFLEDKKPIKFRPHFKASINDEPKEMQVSLEYITIDGKDEILGRASNIAEDSLLKYFEYEKQKFSIDNYLITADEMSHRITRNLAKYISSKEIILIRLALREVIINAIEHGNLNISFEKKSELLIQNKYFTFITERQHDKRYKNKKISIEYSISKDKIFYKITDEGNGFDYKQIYGKDLSEFNEKMISHGRGLIMAKKTFDNISFNKTGNQIILTKFL